MSSLLDTWFVWYYDIEGLRKLTIKIPLKKYDIDDIFAAEDALRKIGITFDTGAYIGPGPKYRDWEFDDSLRNPKKKK